MRATTAQLMVRTLADAGVEVVAGIPGHTTFALADALLDEPRIRPFLIRHESIASFAADAYYRVSGKLMAVFAHTFAGTANLVTGIGTAYADSSAMLVIHGEEVRATLGRGAYQEFSRGMDADMAQVLRHVTKRAWQCHTPLQIVEQTLRALRTATTGRPGPVSLSVFFELWEQEAEIPQWPDLTGYLPATGESRPTTAAVDRAVATLTKARRPLIVAGNGINLGRAQPELLALAEATGIPVATTVTGKGAFPEDHVQSVGVVGWVGTEVANWTAQHADVVLAVGARMTESATSSWQPNGAFDPNRTVLIQSDIEPTEIGNVFPVGAGLLGDASAVLTDLREALDAWTTPRDWRDEVGRRRDEWAQVALNALSKSGQPMPVGPVLSALRDQTANQPLNIVCDVGKHHKWVAQQFPVHAGDMVVSSMGAGTMGIGPCGAVGAALGRPRARTIAWVGDGGMSMSLPVLPTVAEHNVPVLFVVIDDGAYGAVVNSQLNRYGRTSFAEFNGGGTRDYRLDLAAVAEAAGVPARRVETIDDCKSALDWGLHHDGPALIDVIVDRASSAPPGGGFKLGDVWNHPIFPWVGVTPR
ncbi:thiamine pyrophosphate-binding protein [Actinophytocola sp.]|uniref:thiamine pyrophosphate-binding protein n=1 Tax=Actinophytocola sp. TaxID=1872138 RepID=UPI003D6A9043